MKHDIIYRKILVPHDGSELAISALPHAAALAVASDAEIVLLRVIASVEKELIMTDSVGMYPPVSSIGDTVVDVVKENKKRAIHQLEKLKNSLEADGVRFVKLHVEEGFAGNVIVDTAKTEHSDLIVMSTHGRSGLGRALLGSVADYVIRHAACPVLVVHPNPKTQKGGE